MEREGLLIPARESRGIWRLTETGSNEYRRTRGPAVPTEQSSTSTQRSAEPLQPEGTPSPIRAKVTTQRVIRSTAVAEYVKRIHDKTCQICGTRLTASTGAYAEAAHIQPLGQPHDGPDVPSNVLCLCPNHHVLFDLGALRINDDLSVIDQCAGAPIGRLTTHPEHKIERRYLEYHRSQIGGGSTKSQ
nr:HNH endonuclease [Streptomyces sp. 2231.1]